MVDGSLFQESHDLLPLGEQLPETAILCSQGGF
jgi:hypothetical protein